MPFNGYFGVNIKLKLHSHTFSVFNFHKVV